MLNHAQITFLTIVLALASLLWSCFMLWVWWMLFWVLRWTYLEKRRARDDLEIERLWQADQADAQA